MNKYFIQKFNDLKLKNNVKYIPLAEDAEISMCENTPKTYTPPRKDYKVLHLNRKLFQNKSFKIHKRSRDSKSKTSKNRLRVLFQELQYKIQSLKGNTHNGLGNCHSENKASNCVTPNHKTRSMLGRTPTKLYSPFSIETPPLRSRWRQELPEKLENTPISMKEWQSSPKRKLCNKTKKSLATMLYD